MSTVSRKTKWHPTPPPPPSPKIVHLPRRRRTHLRKQTNRPTHPLLLMNPKYDPSYNDNLLYQESHGFQPDLLNFPSERRQRVEERKDEEEECGRLAEEKWRFQAEMLRAECNLLRMEREHALKKLEKKRVKMETTLRSAVQTLLSGRKKIEEGKNGNAKLEEEIEDLEEKIEELQKSASRLKDSDVGKCSNFKKKACLLQHGLEKLGVGVLSNEKELQQVADSMNTKIAHKSDDQKSIDKVSRKEERCSGRCKAMVLRIMEQVRAETEQWSQMQNMLDKVRGEMEEMQASRDYWELEARNSDHKIQSLSYAVEEWKGRALDYEKQVKALQLKQKKKIREDRGDLLPLGEQLVKERLALKENKKTKAEKELLPPLSLAKQIAKEKRWLIRGLKENVGSKQELSENGRGANRSPLGNIANSSLLERQSHRIAFDCRSPESSRIRESFRK